MYAKAEARAAAVAALEPAYLVEAPSEIVAEDDGRRELWARAIATPTAILVAVGLVHTGLGHAMVRTFLSMWVHELGHAIAAWFCAIPATPGPWATHTWDERSVFFGIVLFAGWGWLARSAWRGDRRWLAPIALGVVFQVVGTFALSLATVRTFVTFWGDGGCMLLGALLTWTVAVGPENPLRRHQLRWGFLAIGAAAIADAGSLWWSARTNEDVIPFGVQEGVGLSDPSRLTEWAGWSVTTLVHRYLLVLAVSAAIVVVGYAYGLWRARSE